MERRDDRTGGAGTPGQATGALSVTAMHAESGAMSEFEAKVLDRLMESRTMQLFGPVTQAVAHRVIASLLCLAAEDESAPVTLFINSPGGSVSDGLAIYDTMRFISPDVRVVCTGMTASIATIILIGGADGQRFALPSTRFLIHQPLIPGNIFGPASDLEIAAQEILKTRGRLNQLLAAATGQDIDRVTEDTQRDYWLDADEALEYGLVSKVVSTAREIG